MGVRVRKRKKVEVGGNKKGILALNHTRSRYQLKHALTVTCSGRHLPDCNTVL